MEQQQDVGWCMTKRFTFRHNSLFKLKQVSPTTFITDFSVDRRVNLYDFDLTPLPHHLIFSQEIHAIEHLFVEGREFVVAGLGNGGIQGLEMRWDGGVQGRIELLLQEQMGHNIYINDILSLGDGKVINCYNSGNLAIWNVSQIRSQNTPLAYIKQVHRDYVYKLRRVDSARVVSCGNDHSVNLIDLQIGQPTDSYYHDGPVWCCYPVDHNLLCSAGLMGYLSFRDVRSAKMVQALQLLTTEASFVTRLDGNRLVFGDKRQLSRCDLRMLRREVQCSQGMRASAESILVTEEGGVAVGRGGDLCLFRKGGQQVQVEQKTLKADNSTYSSFLQIIAGINYNMLNYFMPAEQDSEFEEEVEEELDEEEYLEDDDSNNSDDIL